ncbi:hypothetical protein V8E54_013267 [Elaphomyces granulatus]
MYVVFPRSADLDTAEVLAAVDMSRNPTHGDVCDFSTDQNIKTSKIPPRLPLLVKRLLDERSIDSKRAMSSFCGEGNPWTKYKQPAKEGNPGKTCLAYDYRPPGSIVAIKQYSVSEASAVVYLAYERMDLSLEQLHLCIKLEESHISIICKEVLQGLAYIHQQLQICYIAGQVKIGKF